MKILYIQPWGFADYSQIERFQKGYLKRLSLPRVMFEVLYFVSDLVNFEVLDLNLELLENPQKKARQILLEKVREKLFDAIFLTFPAVALGNLIGEIINWCKELAPQTPLVVGGGAVELMAEDILKFWPIDYLYWGYGQEIPQIIEQLAEPQKHLKITGLYHKTGKKIVFPKLLKGEAKLLDDYKPQDFYSLKGNFNFQAYLKRYQQLGIQPSSLVEMTRGCSLSCNFCAINKTGQVLYRKPETVTAEIEYLLQQGINEFYLIDPTLGLNRKLTDNLLTLLTKAKDKNPILSILGVTRTDFISQSFAKKIKKSGFSSIGLGIETMTDSQLDKIQKKTVPKQAKLSINILNSQGIKTKLFVIHFPDVFSKETIQFLLDLRQENVDFIIQSSFFRPLYEKGEFQEAPDFRRFDQRLDCRCLGLDSATSIIEWLLVNLAFPSTDVDSKNGDRELEKALRQLDLGKFKQQISEFKKLALIVNQTKYYYYDPKKDLDYLKPNLFVGSGFDCLTGNKDKDLIIINLFERSEQNGHKKSKSKQETGGTYGNA